MKSKIISFNFFVGKFIVVSALGSFFSLSAFSETPHGMTIRSIIATGSGCQQGTVSATLSPDLSSFSLLMDNYSAESNGNFQLDRKNCEIQAELAIPAGWSYSIISADYRGFVNVDLGTTATHQAIYSFDRSRPINERPGFENSQGRYSFKATNFKGPFSDNYYIRDELNPSIAPWSPCSSEQTQTLYISTYLMSRTTENLARSAGLITLDSVDGSVATQSFGVRWKKCSGVTPNPGPVRPNPPYRPPTPRPRPPRY